MFCHVVNYKALIKILRLILCTYTQYIVIIINLRK